MDSKNLHGVHFAKSYGEQKKPARQTDRRKLDKGASGEKKFKSVKGWVSATNVRAKTTEPKTVLSSRQDWKGGTMIIAGKEKENLLQQPRPPHPMLWQQKKNQSMTPQLIHVGICQ